jgi:hypothetical protein
MLKLQEELTVLMNKGDFDKVGLHLKMMKKQRIDPRPYSFNKMLMEAFAQKNLNMVTQIREIMQQNGVHDNLHTYNILFQGFIENDLPQLAEALLAKLPFQKNILTYHLFMRLYLERSDAQKFEDLKVELLKSDLEFESQTYSLILQGNLKFRKMGEVVPLLEEILTNAKESFLDVVGRNIGVMISQPRFLSWFDRWISITISDPDWNKNYLYLTIALKVYSKTNKVVEFQEVLTRTNEFFEKNNMKIPSATLNVWLQQLVYNNKVSEAYDLVMDSETEVMDISSYHIVMGGVVKNKACAADLFWNVLQRIRDRHMEFTHRTYSIFVTFLIRRNIDSPTVDQLMSEMKTKSISFYAILVREHMRLRMFERMHYYIQLGEQSSMEKDFKWTNMLLRAYFHSKQERKIQSVLETHVVIKSNRFYNIMMTGWYAAKNWREFGKIVREYCASDLRISVTQYITAIRVFYHCNFGKSMKILMEKMDRDNLTVEERRGIFKQFSPVFKRRFKEKFDTDLTRDVNKFLH